MNEVQSKTEQLIYRNSYRKHKERLNDIRHNITVKDFHPLAKRPSNKKAELLNKTKLQQITHENDLLKDKIQHIKHRMPDPSFLSHTQNMKAPVRYQEEIKIDSVEMEDGQPVKCIIPAHKYRANPRPMLVSYHSQKQANSTKKQRPMSFHRTERTKKTHSQQAPRQQLYYHLPQRNQQRQVINRKTVILSPTQSCLFQLSLIGDRLLIAAHIMGLDSYCLTELLSAKQTKQLLKEYDNNYEQFYPKVVLQQSNNKYKSIRINWKEPQPERKISQQELNKYKMRTQQNFIQRNYYTLIKKQQESRKEDKSDKPTITHDKLQQLMDRLAVPAKRYSLRDNIPHVKQHMVKQQQPAVSHQIKPIVVSKISVHIDSKETEDRRNQMKRTSDNSIKMSEKQSDQRYDKTKEQPLAKESKYIKLKQTNSEEFEPQKQKDSVINSFLNSNMHNQILKPVPLKSKEVKQELKVEEDDEEVEYLDGQNDYEQSFEVLPQYSLQNKLESKKKDTIKNQSKVISNIEEVDYQNQQYQAMLESNVIPITPKPQDPPKQHPPPKGQAPEQEDYQQYVEQFQN